MIGTKEATVASNEKHSEFGRPRDDDRRRSDGTIRPRTFQEGATAARIAMIREQPLPDDMPQAGKRVG